MRAHVRIFRVVGEGREKIHPVCTRVYVRAFWVVGEPEGRRFTRRVSMQHASFRAVTYTYMYICTHPHTRIRARAHTCLHARARRVRVGAWVSREKKKTLRQARLR